MYSYNFLWYTILWSSSKLRIPKYCKKKNVLIHKGEKSVTSASLLSYWNSLHWDHCHFCYNIPISA